jgi:hypothetical protein
VRVAEGAASAAEKQAAQERTLLILDPRGAPLAAASWAVFRDEQVLAQGVTDADGTARFGAPAGVVEGLELAVAHAIRPPVRLALGPDQTSVTLPAGAAVTGRVTLDGAPPQDSFEINLNARYALFPGEGLPPAVWGALGREGDDVTWLSSAVAADGSFRFEGLPAPEGPAFPERGVRDNWSLELFWPQDAAVPAEQRQRETPLGYLGTNDYLLRGPAEGIVLALESEVRVIGTVVDPLTRQGIPGARVMWGLRYPGGSSYQGSAADESGRFELRFERGRGMRLELGVATRDGAGSRAYALDLNPEERFRDLGELALAATHMFAFRALTLDGEPIAGAQAYVPPRPWALSAASDAEGNGSVLVKADARELQVSAPGFETASVPIPLGQDELEVRLRGSTVLEVRFASPDERLGVELCAAGELFEDPDDPQSTPRTSAVGLNVSYKHEDGSACLFLAGAGGEPYIFSGLRAGVAFELRAVDRCGNLILSRPVTPFTRGERRSVTLECAPPEGTLRGRVVASGGAPVYRAFVRMGPPGEMGQAIEVTQADGRFSFDGVAGPRVGLAVTAVGCAPWIGSVEVGGETLEIALERGRDVRVSVVGPGGAHPPETHVVVLCFYPVWGAGGRVEDDGTALLQDLPRDRLPLVVFAAGQRFERELPAEVGEIRVELPPWSVLTVAVEGDVPLTVGEHRNVQVRPLQGNGDEFFFRPLEDAQGEARFEPVFPGRYEVSVHSYNPFDPSAASRLLSDPLIVEVTADAPARATLELRAP